MDINRKLSIEIHLPDRDTDESELSQEHSKSARFDIYNYGGYYPDPGITYSTERHITNNYVELISLLSNIIYRMNNNTINQLIIYDNTTTEDILIKNTLLLLIAKCCKWYQKQYTNLQYVLHLSGIHSWHSIEISFNDVNKFINDFDTADNNYINNLIILSNSTDYLKSINSIITTCDTFSIQPLINISKNYNKIHKRNYLNKLYENEIYKNHKLCYLHIYLDLNNNGIMNYDQDIKICIRNTYLEQLRIKLYLSETSNNKKHKNIYLRYKLLKNNNLTKIIFCQKYRGTSCKFNIIANRLIANLFDSCKHEICYINKNFINIYRKGNNKLITKNMDILEYFNDLCKHKIYKNKYNRNMLIKTLYLMYMNNISPELIFIFIKYYIYN